MNGVVGNPDSRGAVVGAIEIAITKQYRKRISRRIYAELGAWCAMAHSRARR